MNAIKTGTQLIEAAKIANPRKFATALKRHSKRFSGRVAELSAAGDVLPSALQTLSFDDLKQ